MNKKTLDIIPRRGTNSDGTKAERRKNTRFPVNVPVEASWSGPNSQIIKQEATAKQVNAQGGFLLMSSYPDVGSRVTLVNLLSAETAEARVLATPSSRKGVAEGIIVELTIPSEHFWGITFLSKKAGVELQKLENSLRSSGVDLRLLNEFRDAVDYVRLASAAVQELRERQLQARDEEEVHALLVVERIRRGSSMCTELIVDLDAGKITSETKGLEEFARFLDQAATRVRSLLKRREPERAPERTTERVSASRRQTSLASVNVK
jgi:hypothetical protein